MKQEKSKVIYAAGGLVLNEDEQVLMIFRRGKWDLPKGKWEKGESIEECAVREVQEECGVLDVLLGRRLATTIHSYVENERTIEKHTAWFLMLAQGDWLPTPQVEEDIEIARWVSQSEARELLKESYTNIREVFVSFSDTFKEE